MAGYGAVLNTQILSAPLKLCFAAEDPVPDAQW
jgi:hypothetical protein